VAHNAPNFSGDCLPAEGVAVTRLVTPSHFVIRFSDGGFLQRYLNDQGAFVTYRRQDARVFHGRATAERTAQLFNGEIVVVSEGSVDRGNGTANVTGAVLTDTSPKEGEAVSVSFSDQQIQEFQAICHAANSRYQGLQLGLPEIGLETLVLHTDGHGSTLAIPVSQFNLENVRAHVEASNLKWFAGRVRTKAAR